MTTKRAKDAKICSGSASSSFALFASFVVTLFVKDGMRPMIRGQVLSEATV